MLRFDILLHFKRENSPTVRFGTARTAKLPPKMAVILKDTFILYPVSEQECPVLVVGFSTGQFLDPLNETMAHCKNVKFGPFSSNIINS